MNSNIEIVQIPAVVLALTEAFVSRAEISSKIIGLFDTVYSWKSAGGVQQAGNNYALYDQFQGPGMRMRVGFPVDRRFADTEKVICTEFEGGLAVHARHHGTYDQLFEIHRNLNDWCASHDYVRRGLSWEVYGDWHEDEAKRVTEVYVGISAA